ncbi:MAG: 4'-phosphopantetheinyl transferase superfamily protein [Bacillota bacterium]|nr:4'-phosphopantetheinyl transferase superfamily protein [Bacillota bacterium]
MLELYALNINEPIEKQKYEEFYSLISSEKKDRINKFHFIDDRKRSLYGDLLIRQLITKKLGVMNDKISFGVTDYGKPYLINDKNFHYNISHSKDWVFCGISDYKIGVDIEHIKVCDFDLAERFFAKEEYEFLKMALDEECDKLFFDIWCMKESYIKYKGLGLAIPLDSFRCERKTPFLYLVKNNNELLNIRNYHIDNTYSAAVCSPYYLIEPVNYITLQQIYNNAFMG